jgi:protein tyrosine/serine phosphatase
VKKPINIDSFWGYLYAQAYATIVEHNFTNAIRRNFHKISEDAFRSSQPTTYQLRKIIKKHGIKTVLNLRGYERNSPLRALEERVCEEAGVKLVYIEAYSRKIPEVKTLEEFKRVFESIEYPVLIHCKSGADRAGLGSTLFLHYRHGVPLEHANQLKLWPYGHIKHARTGLIDLFVELYSQRDKDAPSDPAEFAKTLDRDKLEREFKAVPFFENIVDKVLRRE